MVWLKRIALVVVGLLVLLVGGVALYAKFEYTLVADLREAVASAPHPADPVDYGAFLFRVRGCAGCHTLTDAGSETTIGPALDGIGARQTPDQIRVSIIDPAAVIAPCAAGPCQFQMPEFGTILEPAQIDALVAYLDTQ